MALAVAAPEGPPPTIRIFLLRLECSVVVVVSIIRVGTVVRCVWFCSKISNWDEWCDKDFFLIVSSRESSFVQVVFRFFRWLHGTNSVQSLNLWLDFVTLTMSDIIYGPRPLKWAYSSRCSIFFRMGFTEIITIFCVSFMGSHHSLSLSLSVYAVHYLFAVARWVLELCRIQRCRCVPLFF